MVVLFLSAQPAWSNLQALQVFLQALQTGTLDIALYSGAIGDGIADDTAQVQKALTVCSNQGLTCVISANKSFLITKELYLWGEGKLVGVDSTSSLYLNTGSVPYVLNVGIGSTTVKTKMVW